MKKDDIRNVYDKIDTTKEMDNRIKKGVLESMENQTKTSFNWKRIRYASVVAAALAIAVVGVFQVPGVSVKASELWKTFTNYIIVEPVSDSKDAKENIAIMQCGDYIKIREGASKKEGKYDTLQEIEQELGVSLLQSPSAYEKDKNLFTYQPYVSNKDEIYGVKLQNNFYIVGDLKNVQTETNESTETRNVISYEDGAEYGSPINMEISIRTDKNAEADYKNHELEYAGENWNLSDAIKSEVYDCKNLQNKIVLYKMKTDGIITWNDKNITSMTFMQFVYNDVEYLYCGDVSFDVMKEIAENLK